MRDTNIVMLEGISGDDVKFGRGVNGVEYCTFSLCLNNTYDKDLGGVKETTVEKLYIRIICFDNKKAKHIEYLRSVGFRRGMRVQVKGFLNSRRTEVKGQNIIQLSVVVRDISVLLTSSLAPLMESAVPEEQRNE